MLVLQFAAINHAWTDDGHMLVAQIAKDNLKEDHFSRITEHFYSKDYRSHRPKDYPSANDTDDLPGCAVWLDDANKIFPGERTWHFKDVPYKVDVDVCDPGPTSHYDILWALREAIHVLKWHGGPYVDTALVAFGHGYWLRALVHLVGDLHQPLHNLNGCSKHCPNGDRGGNDYKIKSDVKNWFHGKLQNVTELHLLWDLAGGRYIQNWPLDDEGRKKLESDAQELQRKFPESHFTDTAYHGVSSFTRWHDQTAALQKRYNTPYGEMITDEYLDFVKQTCESQIALAGYRLKSILETLHPSETAVVI